MKGTEKPERQKVIWLSFAMFAASTLFQGIDYHPASVAAGSLGLVAGLIGYFRNLPI